MPISLSELMSTLQNGVTAIKALTKQVSVTFPQATALSTVVPTGTITFTSSQATSFLTIITSSGATMKVPLYT